MSDNAEQAFKKLGIQFLSVSVREQILILLCGIIAIVLLLYTFVLEPTLEETDKLAISMAAAQTEKSQLAQQIVKLQGQLNNDPNEEVRQRIEVLNKDISLLEGQLLEQFSNLVSAEQMPKMLENLLVASKDIKLIELSSIAPTPIFLSKAVDGDKEQKADLYRHGVSLVLEGSYFDIQSYLQKLESLQWKFYWKKFDYQVDTYPKGKIELEIYTLSTSTAFIGV